MKISYNWLRQYADLQMTPEELSGLLTGCGLEVESLEKWQSIGGGLKGLVVGEVKSCRKMPDSDHLSITSVDTGTGQEIPVVCGAPNVAAGQKVIVATVGTILSMSDKKVEIKKSKIRGYLSEGMICAEDEIGTGTSHEGIIVLDPSAKIGTPAAEYFGMEEDHVFEIGLTPNRTDAMSHIGVARDILAVLKARDFGGESRENHGIQLPFTGDFRQDDDHLNIDVSVEDPIACPRYTGVSMTGVTVAESPQWLKNRLNAIGLRPINNIVDITNFVLHETGQPLHAFDAGRITGNRIVVKKLPAGTSFITLDEKERILNGEDLIICNEKEGMCIGGVFGGLHSGVTESTKNIFLESACFDPGHIRRTSRNHDLQTDSSFRFERGIDPGMTLYALKRAALLIKELAGGKISSEVKDVNAGGFCKEPVLLVFRQVDDLIGKNLPRDLIRTVLKSLDFEIIEDKGDALLLRVPFYRHDVSRPADVIEEILRIYGYNNIAIPSRMSTSVIADDKAETGMLRETLANYLASCGYYEIMNNSLTGSQYYSGNPDFPGGEHVVIMNALSRDLDILRRTLLFGGLETIAYNLNRKTTDLQIFEFGREYSIVPGRSDQDDVTKKYSEKQVLALYITGNMNKPGWKSKGENADIFALKSICYHLMKRSGIGFQDLIPDELHSASLEGIVYRLKNDELLRIGRVTQPVLKQFDIDQEVYYAAFNWDLVVRSVWNNRFIYQELPRFPEVRRDLALLVDHSVSFSSLEKIAYETEKKLLKQVNLFDIYEGAGIAPGKKSYALSFILQDTEKTLTDREIEKIMERLVRAFEGKTGASLR